MATRPFPAAPFTPSVSGNIEQRLAQVADAINRKADATTTPAFAAILLLAPDHSTWRVSIDNSGTLVTVQLP